MADTEKGPNRRFSGTDGDRRVIGVAGVVSIILVDRKSRPYPIESPNLVVRESP
jgi:hypothetical protein